MAASLALPAELAAFPAETVTLQDRTAWPRLGLRGPATPDWCQATGLPFPDAVNRVARSGGLRVARLGRTELLLLGDGPGTVLPAAAVPGALDGFRQETWAWLRLQGPGAMQALSALTSADLRPQAAPPGSVVQTRAAGLDVVLVIDTDAVDILFDIAAARYFHEALADRCPAIRR